VVSTHRVWKRLLGVEHTVIEAVELEGDERAETSVPAFASSRSLKPGQQPQQGRRLRRPNPLRALPHRRAGWQMRIYASGDRQRP
jgi:hypothetical protein